MTNFLMTFLLFGACVLMTLTVILIVMVIISAWHDR